MDNSEEKLILRAAIDIAEKNGYKGHLRYLPTFILPTSDIAKDEGKKDTLANDMFYFNGRTIIFSVDFQKAFFPEGEEDKEKGVLKNWKYHTAEMYKTNPIKYIEKYL